MILGLVDEAVANGARQAEACALINIDARTLERWREQGIGDDRRAGPKHPPPHLGQRAGADDKKTHLDALCATPPIPFPYGTLPR